ncbi:fibroblast growth factor 18 isoform X1 [Anomalospiza imberbis]|uniref:fibroblast growth factor 18 isoform X1 n=1 Tax=Anomalospiza imberbis TaxID=187417 RepID=UPI00358E2BEF
MYSLLSACTCLCLHFLLLCFQVQMFAAEENVDFRIHVENQTRARDDVSRKQLRLYQLYSRTSGKHIQVLGRRISAKGEDGDKYASSGNRHFWKSSPDQREGDRFLPLHEQERQASGEGNSDQRAWSCFGQAPDCYNSSCCGHWHSVMLWKMRQGMCCTAVTSLLQPDGTSKECVFIEKVLENNYTALMSAKYSGWYVGFTKKGRPRKGPKTRENQQDVHFMKRYPKGQMEIQKPFKYTTVTKRTKRIRPTNPS